MTVTREPLPDTRQAITKKFKLVIVEPDGTRRDLRLYFTVGLYDDGRPGELFIHADKMGSLTSGALESLAIMMSIGMQYGIPLYVLTSKLRHMRFEPNGLTGDQDVKLCSSVMDLLAQWLDAKFPPPEGS